MKTHLKKLLALATVFVMVFGMISTIGWSAYAADITLADLIKIVEDSESTCMSLSDHSSPCVSGKAATLKSLQNLPADASVVSAADDLWSITDGKTYNYDLSIFAEGHDFSDKICTNCNMEEPQVPNVDDIIKELNSNFYASKEGNAYALACDGVHTIYNDGTGTLTIFDTELMPWVTEKSDNKCYDFQLRRSNNKQPLTYFNLDTEGNIAELIHFEFDSPYYLKRVTNDQFISSADMMAKLKNSFSAEGEWEGMTYTVTLVGNGSKLTQSTDIPGTSAVTIASFEKVAKVSDTVYLAIIHDGEHHNQMVATENNGKIVSILFQGLTLEGEPTPDAELKADSNLETPKPAEVINITPQIKGNDLSATVIGDLEKAMGITATEKQSGMWVWMELIQNNNPDAADVAKIEKALNGKSIGAFLDISMFKQVVGGNKEKVAELNEAVTVSVVVPETLRKAGREFSIIYVHDGGDPVEVKAEKYDATTGVLTFKANKFSTYALTYTDIATDLVKSPATGDTCNPTMWILLVVVSVLGMVAVLPTMKLHDGKHAK